MDTIQKEHERVWNSSRLSKTTANVDEIIQNLQKARDAIAEDPNSRQITLAKLQNPVKASVDAIFSGLKDTHGLHNKYTRALDKVFKDKIPPCDIDALSAYPPLINRAIYLHLLREGLFDVASTFHTEALEREMVERNIAQAMGSDYTLEHPLGMNKKHEESMTEQFSNMYHILSELKDNHNLQPAIDWARKNEAALETRGSHLEFELCRLQFVNLFLDRRPEDQFEFDAPMRALQYAQTEFQSFRGKYLIEIQQLLGAIPFFSNLEDSPYSITFSNPTTWDEVAMLFTREFCSLLKLSADSPLYVAITAGTIALPTLLKLQTIQKQKRAEWTSSNELPVETPLPPSFQFHSVFVCPVSKEQTTDQNPPMMLPCCHVIAQESLKKLSKNAKFKCPYCPVESQQTDAKRVFL